MAMTEKMQQAFNAWWENPTTPTEEAELSLNDAVSDFFGFPDFIREEEAQKIKERHAAERQAQFN